jgi:hypothetical protein
MDDNPFVDDTRDWVDQRGFTLSDRVWSNRADMRASIDAILRVGVNDGTPVEEVVTRLVRYVSPAYSQPGDGKAEHAANRLAGNEMRRANALSVRDVAMVDPAGGYLKYVVAASHISPDECSDIASHDEGFGVGVYRAKDTPLPPRHVGCKCSVEQHVLPPEDISAFVEQLRVEYGLDSESDDLSPADLVTYRQETAKVRDAVQLLFRGWLDQTGLVTREQLLESSPSVAEWVSQIREAKRARKALG